VKFLTVSYWFREKKKDEPQHEVVYRLVSTDNNGDGQISLSPGPTTKLPGTTTLPSPRPGHDHRPLHGSGYEYRDSVEPGCEEYESSQIRVIPGSGDALALHQGAPPATDPLDDPDGFYSHDATMPDVSRFHGYHAISPILGSKHDSLDRRQRHDYELHGIGGGIGGVGKGVNSDSLSGEYDNMPPPTSTPTTLTRYPVDNYTTIHQFINPHGTSTPNPPGKLNGTGVHQGHQGHHQYGHPPPPPKSTFKGSGFPPVLRAGNGHMGLEDGHKDLESMYSKPNKPQRNPNSFQNGSRNGGMGHKGSHGGYH
jgi:hypothetical protein